MPESVMNKTLKWILIAVGALAIIFVVAQMAMKKGNDGVRVTAETAKRRTLVETVSASGKL
ncbi:MAG TPA: efflux transporter periplasmic adaptor subunit, partial [Flavisolibacter sp.]|nr:efflux transporter periplasmic adaptor subunit [Flavisolibacter sp.]